MNNQQMYLLLARKDDKNVVRINKSYQPRNDEICQRIKHKINMVYWITHTKPGKWPVLYSCVGGSILFLSTIFLLDFGTILTAYYFWFFSVLFISRISNSWWELYRYHSKKKSILKVGLCRLINLSTEIKFIKWQRTNTILQ